MNALVAWAALLPCASVLSAANGTPARRVTFNKDIAPIVFEYCAPCHRPGESGPFNLLRYDDVKQRARQIVTVTGRRYMPPWLPEPGFGKFEGERRLSEEQIQLIARWVREGAAEGAAPDLPATPEFTEGWQLGEPDLVLTQPKAFLMPPDGADVYRNFVFSFPLDGVRYVRALEIRPGNKKVVHHANLLIDRKRSSRWRDGRDGQPGFAGMDLNIAADPLDPESHLLFWKPGSVQVPEPSGLSWEIEKGTDLVLNVHLQASGKPEHVQPSLGLYFTSEAPRHHPLLVQLEHDRALDIPAGTKDFVVTDDFTLPVDVDLLAVYPHAHYLGTQVDGVATLPNGRQEPLIRIRHWDLNWQAVYRYAQPIFLPKGTTISMRWVYDNSSANPANPSRPPKRVKAGDRSIDEMGHLWLQVLPRGPGDQRGAIEEALIRKRALRDPGDFTAHFNLGGMLEAKGDAEGAVRELRLALRIRPTSEVALNTLGAFLQMANQTGEAESLYRAAIRQRADYPDAHYNLALLLLSRDANDDAIPELREAVRLDPEDGKARARLAESLNTRAHVLAGHDRMKEATADFREVAALKPNDADAATNLGVALAMQGELDEARQCLERALRLNPRSESARANLERVRASLRQRQ
jgi:Flp pilus assembly protein TadD/mono/diheme cytochrome c family protein